ncbi:phosphate ABC transporter substrate-binding protein [Effusibacillus lacus]|uniref:Phosphate-binding protein n=2 Tax=Effusibacillus lacus TaxID=1348429 RepID=A0A292YH39_9BACL|nr:phosphate ABC transporter substrate-binding protein [Effusibacillus lacus]
MSKKAMGLAMVATLGLGVLAGCGSANKPAEQGNNKPAAEAPKLSGTIKADGSSTVGPITEAVAEEFKKANPGVQVTVGISGTGGGFKKFTAGETDINDASRKIKDAEKKAAEEKKIEYIELEIAKDGIAVVVNKENTFVDKLTVAELKKIWEPDSKVKKWSEVRPGWPDQEIKLYGPGTDSGTFDYFTEAINGKEKASRKDYTASEDDNTLVKGVSGDKGGLGYFGYAYYEENKDKLKLVPIDNGDGKALAPNIGNIKDGTYKPLSRPLFIYVSKASLQRPEVKAFIKFYIENAPKLVKEVGYVPLDEPKYKELLTKIQ